MHQTRKEKRKRYILKLDYEKVYNTVNSEYMQETLKYKGFGPKWVGWIDKWLHSATGHEKLRCWERDIVQKRTKTGGSIFPLTIHNGYRWIECLNQKSKKMQDDSRIECIQNNINKKPTVCE